LALGLALGLALVALGLVLGLALVALGLAALALAALAFESPCFCILKKFSDSISGDANATTQYSTRDQYHIWIASIDSALHWTNVFDDDT